MSQIARHNLKSNTNGTTPKGSTSPSCMSGWGRSAPCSSTKRTCACSSAVRACRPTTMRPTRPAPPGHLPAHQFRLRQSGRRRADGRLPHRLRHPAAVEGQPAHMDLGLSSVCVKTPEIRRGRSELSICWVIGNFRHHIRDPLLGELAAPRKRRLANIRRNAYGSFFKTPNLQVVRCAQVALFQYDMALVSQHKIKETKHLSDRPIWFILVGFGSY